MKSVLITLRIRLETPGGVTAPEALDAPEQTLVIRRDTNEEPHLPGTTVAGSLRAYCGADRDLVTEQQPNLFGGSTDDGKKRTASPIQVLGTVHRPAGELNACQRTAIDRERGAASNMTFHGVEQLPAGTEFDVHLRWDMRGEPESDERLQRFLSRLHRWRPSIGGGTSTGAGMCYVSGLGHRVYDLNTVDGLSSWLQIGSLVDYPAAAEVEPAAPGDPLFSFEFEIVDGIHIGTGETGKFGDSSEEYSPTAGGPTPVIPGTGLKGVLRSRAEYICRTLGVACCENQSCGDCTPCRIFGFAGVERSAQRAKIRLRNAEIRDAVVQYRRHVAIDRFTGGAAPGLLYTDEVVTAGLFTIRIDLLAETLHPSERRLLEAVIADLHDGLVGIGGRTTAGLGTVRLVDPEKHDLTTSDIAATLNQEAA